VTAAPHIESVAPATGELLGSVPAVDSNAVAALIEKARGAQRAWEAAGPVGRANVVSALGRLLTERADGIAVLLAAEVGKPIAEARAEVTRAAQICGYLGGVGYELGGVVRRSGDPAVTIVARQVPVGVAGIITPWNFPIAIPAWKIVPALVSGCSVLWKPASAAILTAEQFARLASDAGVPDGVLTCVYGGAEVGRVLSEGSIDALSFTGSTTVGSTLRGELGGRVRPRLTLELGGVNVSHVLADADIPRSARDIVAAAYGYAGQKCTATQVIAADHGVADDLAEALREELVALRVGDPLDKGTDVGPVIDRRTAEGLRSDIERLSAQAELVGQAQAPGDGAYVAPTLFRDRDGTSDLIRNEYFGPVAGIVVARSPADHARIARASGMGLTAAIYGTDFDRIRAMLNHVGTGVVAVNRPSTGLDPHVPFGGWGESGGHFSEQGTEGLRFYLKWQTVYWRGDRPDAFFP
jgi:aldehyde dehydrogenase (NAD+)